MATPQNGRGAVRGFILILLVPAFAFSSGCVWRGFAGEVENRPYTDRIIFSADGRQAAYVWTDRCWSLIPFPPAMPIDTLAEAKTEWLGWCSPDGTNHLVRIDAQTHFGGGFGNSRSILGIAFSPDGRHLAAVLEDRIEIIDTGTSEVQQLTCPRGKFTGARWFDNAQLAYATTRITEERPGAVVERSVYRQAVDKGKPVCIFSRTSRRPDYRAFRESWAPDGRTVLLAEGGKLWRLDIASGASSVLLRVAPPAEGQRDSLPTASGPHSQPLILLGEKAYGWEPDTDWDIDWTPDSRQASVLARDSCQANLLLAGVFDCQSWRFTDLKKAFRRDVGGRWVLPISWTPDGFLLVSSLKPGRWAISLVRCSPWQVTDFLGRYGKELPRNMNGVGVVQHLMPGWLAIGPGEKDPMMYAVDYDGKKQSPLTKHPFKVSGDGRRLAEVVSKGKIIIQTLDLPEK